MHTFYQLLDNTHLDRSLHDQTRCWFSSTLQEAAVFCSEHSNHDLEDDDVAVVEVKTWQWPRLLQQLLFFLQRLLIREERLFSLLWLYYY